MHLKPPSAAEGPETATNKPEFQAATLILKAGSYLEAQNMIHSDVFWKEDVVRFFIYLLLHRQLSIMILCDFSGIKNS